jgi:hypothetical protein
MAISASPLLEVSKALKASDIDDPIRLAAQIIYQALIEAELTRCWTPYHTDAMRGLPHNRCAGADERGRGFGAGDPETTSRIVLPVLPEHRIRDGQWRSTSRRRKAPLTCRDAGAGDRDRTGMTSLADCGCIDVYPQVRGLIRCARGALMTST